MEISPMRKWMGFTRFDLARLKKGHAIKSCVSRAAIAALVPTNRSSCCAAQAKVVRAVIGQALSAERGRRSEEHTSELQSLMRLSYAVFCLKKKKTYILHTTNDNQKQYI